MKREVLRADDLTMQFGGLKAVCDLQFSVFEKDIFGIIGPNGAGKTTVFNMLTGVCSPTHGKVSVMERNVAGLQTCQIVALGLTRTFQNIRLFKNLSVRHNILIGFDHNPNYGKSGMLSSLLLGARHRELERSKNAECDKLMSLFQLEAEAELPAKNLPYGDQRRLEIARALACGVRIVLLDEPAAGMNTQETEDLMQTIRRVRDELGVTVVLIEHDMDLVMEICERIAVLDYGKKIAEGTAAEIQANQAVLDAYLGSTKKK